MKYTLSVLLLGLMVFGYAEAPIYGYFWTRYTYENPTTPEVEENEHYFSIERGYIRWKTKNSPVAFSGTIDITSKQNATASTDWQIRLKYAQADWTLPGIGEYLPEAKLMLGLQKVFFGIVDLWEYAVIEKNLEEAEKKMNSAELGVGFHSLLPGGYGEFSVQAFNGNGYAIRSADICCISNDTVVLSLLASSFSKGGRDRVLALAEKWSRSSIEERGVEEELKIRLQSIADEDFPRMKLIAESNIGQLIEESEGFRKQVRGVEIGSLG